MCVRESTHIEVNDREKEKEIGEKGKGDGESGKTETERNRKARIQSKRVRGGERLIAACLCFFHTEVSSNAVLS